MVVPTKMVGRTGVEATILGLGGEGILRTFGHEREAYEVINRAIDSIDTQHQISYSLAQLNRLLITH